MLVMSTTSLLCQGDDFIRDGVRRLLGVAPTEGEIWVNRTGCEWAGLGTNLWRVIRNMPSPDEFMRHARAFVMAGSPGWLNGDISWCEWCQDHGTPIWLVGIGCRQHHEDMLKWLKPLIAVATARDADACDVLAEYKIEHERFLEPGFHAPYFTPRRKDLDVVLTFRRERKIHEEMQPIRMDAYRGVYAKFKRRIACVVVHEPSEIEFARRLFGVEPFFSHEPRRYADIYCRARHYIGGRLHGAVPVLASGGEAHLLYNQTKTEAVTAHDWLPVRCYRHPEWEQIELGLEGDNVQERLQADLAAHAAYLRARIG